MSPASGDQRELAPIGSPYPRDWCCPIPAAAVSRGRAPASLLRSMTERAGGRGLAAGMGDCDSAPGVLGGRFRASTITCCVGTGRTDGPLRPRSPGCRLARRSGHPVPAGTRAAPYRPEHKRPSPLPRLMLSQEWSTTPCRPIVCRSPSIHAVSKHDTRPWRPRPGVSWLAVSRQAAWRARSRKRGSSVSSGRPLSLMRWVADL